jgi:adenosine deaminase
MYFDCFFQVWRLSNADQYEIAMNSVRQSGFPIEQKMEWIGEGITMQETLRIKN